MQDKKFGASGDRVVEVEEFLTGPEVSVLAFSDGVTLKPMVSSMDHKRALDGDEGLNTGGMGTVAPEPLLYRKKLPKGVHGHHFSPTLRAMQAEGCPLRAASILG